MAGGMNYGDATVDEYDAISRTWRRAARKRLSGKREFASHATVPTEWFPHCEF